MEAEVERLPRFGPDPVPKVALPKESTAPSPPVTEASGSAAKSITDVGAPAAAKEAAL